MLESKVDQENHNGEDQRGHEDEERRSLQLLPRGPGDLFGQLRVGLFKIVNELSHLCLQWAGGKLEAGIPWPNVKHLPNRNL